MQSSWLTIDASYSDDTTVRTDHDTFKYCLDEDSTSTPVLYPLDDQIAEYNPDYEYNPHVADTAAVSSSTTTLDYHVELGLDVQSPLRIDDESGRRAPPFPYDYEQFLVHEPPPSPSAGSSFRPQSPLTGDDHVNAVSPPPQTELQFAESLPMSAPTDVSGSEDGPERLRRVKCRFPQCTQTIGVYRPQRQSTCWKNWNEHMKLHLNISKRTKRRPTDDTNCPICNQQLTTFKSTDNAARIFKHIVKVHRP